MTQPEFDAAAEAFYAPDFVDVVMGFHQARLDADQLDPARLLDTKLIVLG